MLTGHTATKQTFQPYTELELFARLPPQSSGSYLRKMNFASSGLSSQRSAWHRAAAH